jgi:hypothetical protein
MCLKEAGVSRSTPAIGCKPFGRTEKHSYSENTNSNIIHTDPIGADIIGGYSGTIARKYRRHARAQLG